MYAPGSDKAIALEVSSNLDRIVLDDGDNSQNPYVRYPTGGLSAGNSLRLGDTVTTLTGVIDHIRDDNGNRDQYVIIPIGAPTFTVTNDRISAADLQLGNLKVASLNVLNYFETIDDGSDTCGPSANARCRSADDGIEFRRQKTKIIMAIVGMDADIIGLMEIENNDHTKQTNSFLEEPQGHTLKYIDVISDDYFVDTSTMS